MSELIIVTQILGSVAGLAFFIWTVRYCYKVYANKKMLNEIKKKQSRVSVLKLMLKARLNRSSNSLSKTFNGETILINMFQEKYSKLVGYDLTTQEHYQNIINTLKEMATESESFFSKKIRMTSTSTASDEAELKVKVENKDPKVLEYERVIDFEFGCLIMIREIIGTNEANRILIESYNEVQDSKREMIKPPVEMTIEDRDLLFGMLDLKFEKRKSDKNGKPGGIETDGPDHIHLELEDTNAKSA